MPTRILVASNTNCELPPKVLLPALNSIDPVLVPALYVPPGAVPEDAVAWNVPSEK